MDNNNDNRNNKNKNNKQGWILVVITTLITAFLVFGMLQLSQDVTTKEISYTEFMEMIEDGKVESVVIESDKYVITPKKDEDQSNILSEIGITYYTGVMDDDTLLQRLDEADIDVKRAIPDTGSALVWNLILTGFRTSLVFA